MSVRVAAGLFRLWVVVSVFWLAAAGAYIVVSYRSVELPDLKTDHVMFDYLVPAYEGCWYYDGKKVDHSKPLAEIAECERSIDRWQVLKTGILIALGIPLIVLGIGWAFVWAFRGFLPGTQSLMPTGGAGLLPGLAVRGDSRGIWCAGAPSKYDNDVAIDSYAKRRCGWVVTGFRRVVVWLNLTATWRY